MTGQRLVDPDSLLWNGPEDGLPFAFAHGAGAPMDAPFMERVADGLARHGVRVCRFEFPYMAQRRTTGKKRPPNPAKVLLEAWREVVGLLAAASGRTPSGVGIGGKSMGGRMASMIADEIEVGALVCFGYPFHPVGSPQKLRVEHLQQLATPALVIQGDRDPMGSPQEVASYRLAATVRVSWLEDGNHDFNPRHKSGHTATEHQGAAAAQAAAFLAEHLA